jgi:hypothetical protein
LNYQPLASKALIISINLLILVLYLNFDVFQNRYEASRTVFLPRVESTRWLTCSLSKTS